MNTNKKLEAVAVRAANNLVNNFKNCEVAIQDAITEMDDGKKFSFGFSITLDLEKNKLVTKLTWAKKYSAECEGEIPDPDQLEMQFEALPPTEETED